MEDEWISYDEDQDVALDWETQVGSWREYRAGWYDPRRVQVCDLLYTFNTPTEVVAITTYLSQGAPNPNDTIAEMVRV